MKKCLSNLTFYTLLISFALAAIILPSLILIAVIFGNFTGAAKLGIAEIAAVTIWGFIGARAAKYIASLTLLLTLTLACGAQTVNNADTALGRAWVKGILAMGGEVAAPTNAPAPAPSLAGAIGTSQLGGALMQFLTDAEPFYGTSNSIVYDDVVLYNNRHVGDLFSAHIPITALSTNGQIAAGAAIAWFRNDWYSLTINAEAGTTWNVPLLGPVYTSIGSGPDWNFHTQQPGAFSYTRLEKNWDIFSGHKFGLTGGIANETSVAGLIYFGGLTLAW